VFGFGDVVVMLVFFVCLSLLFCFVRLRFVAAGYGWLLKFAGLGLCGVWLSCFWCVWVECNCCVV